LLSASYSLCGARESTSWRHAVLNLEILRVCCVSARLRPPPSASNGTSGSSSLREEILTVSTGPDPHAPRHSSRTYSCVARSTHHGFARAAFFNDMVHYAHPARELLVTFWRRVRIKFDGGSRSMLQDLSGPSRLTLRFLPVETACKTAATTRPNCRASRVRLSLRERMDIRVTLMEVTRN
jgi:hypothetical protein